MVVHLDGDTAPNPWQVIATDDDGGQRVVSRYRTRAEAELLIEWFAAMMATEADIVAP